MRKRITRCFSNLKVRSRRRLSPLPAKSQYQIRKSSICNRYGLMGILTYLRWVGSTQTLWVGRIRCCSAPLISELWPKVIISHSKSSRAWRRGPSGSRLPTVAKVVFSIAIKWHHYAPTWEGHRLRNPRLLKYVRLRMYSKTGRRHRSLRRAIRISAGWASKIRKVNWTVNLKLINNSVT